MEYEAMAIREFNLNQMVTNPSILCIGKRGSGKSFLLRDLLYHFRNIPAGIIISPTERMHGDHKRYFPDLYIHDNITDATMNNILLRQSEMINKAKQNIDHKIDPSALLIMENCLSSKKEWSKNKIIQEIMINGRHYYLTNIVTMQCPMGISPDMRLNFDYVFLFKENSMINKKKLYLNYASMFPTFDIFEKIFNKCTDDYGIMVIDNRNNSTNITDSVFWYKAHERNFTFGSQAFVNFHKENYDLSYPNRWNMPNNQQYVGISSDLTSVRNSPCISTDIDFMFEYFVNEDKFKSDGVIINDAFDANSSRSVEKSEESEISQDNNELSIDNSTIDCMSEKFINEDTFSQNYDKLTDTEPNENYPNINDVLTLSYMDETYKLSLNITNLNDHALIKIILDHIIQLKNTRIGS